MDITENMTAKEFIGLMFGAYGDEFNWWLPPSTETFVKELITELGEDDPFVLKRTISLAAKCESCDDMLFCSVGEDGSELWRIYHMTWSRRREREGWPIRWDFPDRKSALEYIRDRFTEDHL
ncbi:MAG: hypothetical protein IKP95_04150 [Ruminococcus sp.]|nr:hypothetical protein [Ruminococcus sp.]